MLIKDRDLSTMDGTNGKTKKEQKLLKIVDEIDCNEEEHKEDDVRIVMVRKISRNEFDLTEIESEGKDDVLLTSPRYKKIKNDTSKTVTPDDVNSDGHKN